MTESVLEPVHTVPEPAEDAELDVALPDSSAPSDPADESAVPSELAAPAGKELAEIPLHLLAHHPLNVREDYHLDRRFLATLRAEQQVISTVVPIPDGTELPDDKPEARYWVVKGNRRLAGHDKLGLPSMECLIDYTRDPNHPDHVINQLVENDDLLRRGLTVTEQATATQVALSLGASLTQIRKKTGQTREEVKAAVAAANLSEDTKQRIETLGYEFTLEEMAMWAEFDDDPEAQEAIRHKLNNVYNCKLAYAIERVKSERAEQAEHERLVAELVEAKVPITDEEPKKAVSLQMLAGYVQGFDPDPVAHRACPGHGAYFVSYDRTKPKFYCTTPAAHGYATRQPTGAGTGASQVRDGGPSRKHVIEGRAAWPAAAKVRQEWLAELCALKTPPKAIQKFVTRMLLKPPQVLCDKLTSASSCTLYRKLGGPADLDHELATASAGRLVMLQFLVIAVAFEYQMSEASDMCKNTWRPNHFYSPCPQAEAAMWLRFLDKEIGPELAEQHRKKPRSALAPHQPTPIEVSLIDGTLYRGDTAPPMEATDPATDDPEDAAEAEDAVAPGPEPETAAATMAAAAGPDEQVEAVADPGAADSGHEPAAESALDEGDPTVDETPGDSADDTTAQAA